MEQHPVPQHIASFEFKLFGNLTVRQFITLAIPMAVATIIFFSNINPFIKLPVTLAIGVFAFFIALVPIGGRPFEKWILAFVRAIFAPTQRIWIKEKRLPEFLAVVTRGITKTPVHTEPTSSENRQKLLAYLKSLPDEELSPMDKAEKLAVERLGLGSTKLEKPGILPPLIVWAQKEEVEMPYNFRSALPQVGLVEEAQESGQYPTPLQTQTRSRYMAAPKVSAHAKPYILSGIEKKLAAKKTNVHPQAHLASETNFAVENVISIAEPDKTIRLVHGVGKTRVRKLHYAPPVGFDLSKLPIRGERRFDMTDELKKRISQAPIDFGLEPTAKPQVAATAAQNGQPSDATPHQTIGTPKAPQIIPKEQISASLAQGVSMTPPKRKADLNAQIKVNTQDQKANIPAAILAQAQIVPLTNKPNVLSGQVTDLTGAPLPGAILTVRDQYGIPVRALKTNKLGQFLSATSLADGQYQIEVEGGSTQFKPIAIKLDGEVLAPMAIRAQQTNIN